MMFLYLESIRQKEHDSRQMIILEQLWISGVMLNKVTCEFYKDSVKFLGHLGDSKGLRADGLPKGMANQLGEFFSTLAEISQPLRELRSTRKAWVWTYSLERAFTELKKALTQPTIPELYHPLSMVFADASSHGLGAVLPQQSNLSGNLYHVHYCPCQRQSATTSKLKEALAVNWACDNSQTTYWDGPFPLSLITNHLFLP